MPITMGNALCLDSEILLVLFIMLLVHARMFLAEQGADNTKVMGLMPMKHTNLHLHCAVSHFG